MLADTSLCKVGLPVHIATRGTTDRSIKPNYRYAEYAEECFK